MGTEDGLQFQSLVQLMVESGVDEEKARIAALKCLGTVAASGFAAAQLAGFAFGSVATPIAGIPAGIMGAFIGGGAAIIKAPTCSEVRSAAQHWFSRGGLGTSP